MLAPRIVPKLFIHNESQKFTLALSNVPGPVKRFPVSTSNGEVMYGLWNAPYIVPAGQIGLCVGFMSWDKTLKIAVTADESICKDTRYLVDKIERNIREEVERMQATPVPTPAGAEKDAQSKK